MNPDALFEVAGIAWLKADERRAERERWNLFDTTGARDHMPIEIERIDEDPKFSDDDEAFQFVVDKALMGHAHAIKALAICYAAMMEKLDAQATERGRTLSYYPQGSAEEEDAQAD